MRLTSRATSQNGLITAKLTNIMAPEEKIVRPGPHHEGYSPLFCLLSLSSKEKNEGAIFVLIGFTSRLNPSLRSHNNYLDALFLYFEHKVLIGRPHRGPLQEAPLSSHSCFIVLLFSNYAIVGRWNGPATGPAPRHRRCVDELCHSKHHEWRRGSQQLQRRRDPNNTSNRGHSCGIRPLGSAILIPDNLLAGFNVPLSNGPKCTVLSVFCSLRECIDPGSPDGRAKSKFNRAELEISSAITKFVYFSVFVSHHPTPYQQVFMNCKYTTHIVRIAS